MFRLNPIILVFFAILLFIGCKKKCRGIEGAEPIENSTFSLKLLKSSNHFPAVPTYYHPDSVKFLDESLNDMNVSYENLNGTYYYKFLNFYSASQINSEITSNYFVKINGQISDTIRLIQRSYRNECDKNTLDYLRLFVNDSLNFSNDSDSESAFYYTIEISIH